MPTSGSPPRAAWSRELTSNRLLMPANEGEIMPNDVPSNQISVNTVPTWLGIANWRYSKFFDRMPEPRFDLTDGLERLVADAALEKHEFFARAHQSTAALRLWVSQELVMTNAFSQIVLRAASQIENVHARAILAEIAYGEHGRARKGFAKRAHPWLLDQLRESVGLLKEEIRPLAPTVGFIGRLVDRICDPLEAVAFIGIGNERLIAPEYEGIRSCFENLLPKADFEPFLRANIDEDITHSRLCYELAGFLIATENERRRFLDAAKESIESRITYFDELTQLTK